MRTAILTATAMLILGATTVARADQQSTKPISCLTYLAQFEGELPFHVGDARVGEAQAIASEGRKLCLAGDETTAQVDLKQALAVIGVTPAGATAPASVTMMQEAERPH
jgi:hypothetical protein